AVRAREALPLSRHRKLDPGQLADQRNSIDADGYADFDRRLVQFPRRERLGLLSGPPEEWESDERAKHESVVRHDGLCKSGALLIRQRFAHGTEPSEPWRHQLRLRDEPVAADSGTHAPAIPRRAIQPA